MRALAAALVAACLACGSGDSATVVEVPPQPLPEPPPSSDLGPPPPAQVASAAEPLRAGDVWRGTYVCAQGRTDLELRVLAASGQTVRAVFAFSHGPSGAEGAYTLQGTIASGQVSLAPDRWIRRPRGYVMVGMRGEVRGARFTGRIDGPGCSTFELAR